MTDGLSAGAALDASPARDVERLSMTPYRPIAGKAQAEATS